MSKRIRLQINLSFNPDKITDTWIVESLRAMRGVRIADYEEELVDEEPDDTHDYTQPPKDQDAALKRVGAFALNYVIMKVSGTKNQAREAFNLLEKAANEFWGVQKDRRPLEDIRQEERATEADRQAARLVGVPVEQELASKDREDHYPPTTRLSNLLKDSDKERAQ